MLYAYMEWYRSPDYATRGVAIDSSGDTSLSVIYLISGEILDDANDIVKHKISLISEEQLEGNSYVDMCRLVGISLSQHPLWGCP